jgi:hypothetical protein
MVKKTAKSKNFHLISPQEQLRFDFFKHYNSNLTTENISKNNVDLNLNIANSFPYNEFNSNLKFIKGTN